jgi:hypothetical protein
MISTTTSLKPTNYGLKRRWLKALKPKTIARIDESIIGPLTTPLVRKRGILGAIDSALAIDSLDESEEDILANARKRRRRLATPIPKLTPSY